MSSFFHGLPASFCVHANTWPSWPQLAIVFIGRPTLGAQAASRTQSEWPSSTCSTFHSLAASLNPHTLTALSQPADTRRLAGADPAATWETSDPGWLAGAQETDVQPIGCARSRPFLLASHPVPGTCWIIEIDPSDDPHASCRPSSCGANEMELIEDSCKVGGETYIFSHTFSCVSFQMITDRSKEEEASTDPNLGCAHEICHTGPS
mmetsp:Transcript_8395/g.14453  ORF Transcript_8395/g.14453 Transcript_8395/m.14453 type:complete len:207 (+) Transcript_8395:540-1160(+)